MGIKPPLTVLAIGHEETPASLTIRPNVPVSRVLFEGQRASGVLVNSGGEQFTAEADLLVLSAGAIASPHLLLLSGVGPAS